MRENERTLFTQRNEHWFNICGELTGPEVLHTHCANTEEKKAIAEEWVRINNLLTGSHKNLGSAKDLEENKRFPHHSFYHHVPSGEELPFYYTKLYPFYSHLDVGPAIDINKMPNMEKHIRLHEYQHGSSNTPSGCVLNVNTGKKIPIPFKEEFFNAIYDETGQRSQVQGSNGLL